MNPNGASAIPVSIVSSALTQGGAAVPVYGYTAYPTDRPVEGGVARPVVVITDSDLVQNGGRYYLEGRDNPLPVFTAPSGLMVVGGEPIAVYSVNPGEWPTPTPPVPNWWEAGGATGAIVAYNAKAASSLANSYINLVNPGTGDAAPGVAPTFATGTGWIFNGTTQYLMSGAIPAINYSALIRYSGLTPTGTAKSPFGQAAVLNARMYLNLLSARNQYVNGSGITNKDVGAPVAGVVGMAGNKAYRDGIDEGITLGAWTGGSNTRPLAIGGVELSPGSMLQLFSGNILAFAVWNNVLSAAQMLAVSTAMANL